jgi:adenylate kinase
MMYVFTGPPGSGKSTQAQLLSDALKRPYFSMGKLLKARAKTDPELAVLIRRGDLVPTSAIEPILQQLYATHRDHLILEGFPRDPNQVVALVRVWPAHSVEAFWLDVPDEVVLERIRMRLDQTPEQREDDTPEVAKHRLTLYHQLEKDLRHALAAAGVKITMINGDQTLDAIHEEIMKHV